MKPAWARSAHLPIWRDAQRLLVWAEQAVRGFPRYHKYTVGAQLRQQAFELCRLVLRAQAADGGQRAGVVANLHLAAEEFKLLLQVGKEVQAFRGWAEFELGVQLSLSVARQSAGWRRSLEQSQGAARGREGAGVRRAEVRQPV